MSKVPPPSPSESSGPAGQPVSPEPGDLADQLTDSQVALLCDVGQSWVPTGDHKAEAERLLAAGFLKPGAPPSPYALTQKATRALASRGVWLDES